MRFILVLFLMGCSQDKFEDYNKYLIDFSNDAALINKEAPDFSQTYFKLDDSIQYDAFCPVVTKKTNGFTIIYVGKKFKDLPEYSQRLIIYHEIGHCFYGLQHTDGHHIMNKDISSYSQNLFYKDSRLFWVQQITTY